MWIKVFRSYVFVIQNANDSFLDKPSLDGRLAIGMTSGRGPKICRSCELVIDKSYPETALTVHCYRWGKTVDEDRGDASYGQRISAWDTNRRIIK